MNLSDNDPATDIHDDHESVKWFCEALVGGRGNEDFRSFPNCATGYQQDSQVLL